MMDFGKKYEAWHKTSTRKERALESVEDDDGTDDC